MLVGTLVVQCSSLPCKGCQARREHLVVGNVVITVSHSFVLCWRKKTSLVYFFSSVLFFFVVPRLCGDLLAMMIGDDENGYGRRRVYRARIGRRVGVHEQRRGAIDGLID